MSRSGSSGLPACAIVVLNWKGREHYPDLLPSLRAAVEEHPDPVPVVIVDNSQISEEIDHVREGYPEFELVLPPQNDFLFSLNPVVSGRPEEVVIVLNNDLRVHPGFIAPLLEHFRDPAVFSVASVAWEWDGSAVQLGQRKMHLERAWFHHSSTAEIEEARHTVEASGGWSAYRRSHFAALGGFDRLFHPMYLEDLDLTYRAWMRGWRSIVEPRSIVYHKGGSSSGPRGGTPATRRLGARNLMLFVLRDVGGWATVVGCLARLPWRIVWRLASGDRAGAMGLLDALRRLPRALRQRPALHRGARLTAREIEALVARPVESSASAKPVVRSAPAGAVA